MQKAVILCGGKGTRLYPLTEFVPKPMLPIKGKPVLEHQIEYLKKNGITDIVLAVGYLWEVIFNHFQDGLKFGVNIKYVHDNCEGTGGALRGLKSILNLNEPILVMNGDTLFDVDLHDMYTYHVNKDINKDVNKDVTIAVAEVNNPDRYGVVVDGKLQEKIKVEKGSVSIGLYIIEPEVLNVITSDYCSLEKDIFPKLKQRFYQYSGEWFDMGTHEVYEEVR